MAYPPAPISDFTGLVAVVTGGGTGMGRELVRQLAAGGASVATCDVSDEHVGETRELAIADAAPGVRVSTWIADVSDESQMLAFADHGRLGELLAPEPGPAEAALARFAAAGVDVEAVGRGLQEKGAAAFVASWRSLVERIAAKAAALDAAAG